MPSERRPYLIAVTLELEDNCGQIITKRKKTIKVSPRRGGLHEDDDVATPIEELFQRFIDDLPDTFEI